MEPLELEKLTSYFSFKLQSSRGYGTTVQNRRRLNAKEKKENWCKLGVSSPQNMLPVRDVQRLNACSSARQNITDRETGKLLYLQGTKTRVDQNFEGVVEYNSNRTARATESPSSDLGNY